MTTQTPATPEMEKWLRPDPGPFFHKFLAPGPHPGPNKRRILPESTPVIRTRSHLCHARREVRTFSSPEFRLTPGPKDKRKIRLESTPALRIHAHLSETSTDQDWIRTWSVCSPAMFAYLPLPTLHCTVIGFALDWESNRSLKHDRECLRISHLCLLVMYHWFS